MHTILIVEDDSTIHMMMHEYLEKRGFRCEDAYSGTEALLHIRQACPDLILMDLMLPGADGSEVLHEIRKAHDVPVIVVSAKGSVQHKVDLLKAGADDYMTKPFSLEELEAAIRPDTILVSIMYVNNEVGAIEPVEQIASLIHGKNPAILFHVDAIQAYGKLTIRPKKQGIDLLSVSAHKIHGPKGVGFLYLDEKVKSRPLLYGGGQQKDLRSGTENVPGIAGMGRAAREIYTDHQEKVEYITGLKDYMTDRMASLPGVTVNSRKGMESAPQIVSASFQGVRSEVLLHALEDKGIYVSSGSACSSNHPAISGTLKAIGVRQELLDSTLRFSFGVFNTREEIDYCMEVLEELLPVLRRYHRG